MTRPSLDLARAVLSALIASGVRDVVYCPGSRLAPFAYALDAACRAGLVRAHVRLDERSAGFLALGLSRAGRPSGERGESGPRGPFEPLPVAVVTTSGGAVAELHAAVAEARHSRLPLVVVSANRPAELQGVGASQTTEQAGIFASHVLSVLALPAGTAADRSLAARIGRTLARARGLPTGIAGPVQIDVALRDPLTPEGGSASSPDFALGEPPARAPATPVPRLAWEGVVEPGLRTVIVAGDGADPSVSAWAGAARLPILAEPSSGLAFDPMRVPYQQSLLSGPLAERVEQVVVTGRPTLSRPVSALLARAGVRIVVVDPTPEWPDAAGAASLVVPALAAPAALAADEDWFAEWRVAAADAGERIAKAVDAEPLSVLGVARTLWREDSRALVLGASNSVRAADLVGVGGSPRRVISNRGLAGIDGTIATAIGLALGSGEPVTALLGDLAFLHDAGALAIPAGEEHPDLVLVIADDAGGGIFAGLEHGLPENAPTFERWFATAQPTSIEGLAAAYGVDYREVRSEAELAALLVEESRGMRIVRVPCARPSAIRAVRNAAR